MHVGGVIVELEEVVFSLNLEAPEVVLSVWLSCRVDDRYGGAVRSAGRFDAGFELMRERLDDARS